MPARAPPREALAPFLPPPSTGGLPVGSAKASAGQRQGPTGTTCSQQDPGAPLSSAFWNAAPLPYRRFPLALLMLLSCAWHT